MSLVPCYFYVYLYVSSSLPSPSPSPSTANAALLDPSRSSPSCYHHRLATHAHGSLTVSSHRSRIGRAKMYCATISCLFRTYSPIYPNPVSWIVISSGGYSQILSSCRVDCLPVIFLDTMCWNPLMACIVRGVITHVSYPKISTACTTTL